MDPVTHFEITFSNKVRAKKFYGETFGWRIQEVPEMDYMMVTAAESDQNGRSKKPGEINGGMMLKDDTANYPLLVIQVKSLDESLSKVQKNGGKIVMPKVPVGDFGLYARVKDTEGNVIGLWETLGQK